MFVFRVTQLQLQFTFGSVRLLRMLVRMMFCFLKSWTNTMLNAVYGTSRRTLLLVVFIVSLRTPAKLFWEGGILTINRWWFSWTSWNLWNLMNFHESSWNSWSSWNFMKSDELSWELMKFMKFHEFHEISWNFMVSQNAQTLETWNSVTTDPWMIRATPKREISWNSIFQIWGG